MSLPRVVLCFVVGVLFADLVLVGLSLATGNLMWWDGLPVIGVFVLVGFVARKVSGTRAALWSALASAAAFATAGYAIAAVLHAPGMLPYFRWTQFFSDALLEAGCLFVVAVVGIALALAKLPRWNR
jgi:hypothetical protein